MSEVPASLHGARLMYRERGLCQECGGKLDQPGKFVRCKVCRDVQAAYARAYTKLKKEGETPLLPNVAYVRRKMKEEAEAARAADKYREKIRKCTECEWARIEETTVFCQFMEGICMKGRYKKHANQG